MRELTPETSLGFDVIEFAEQDLGMTLHPYQKWLYVHALELLPDGQFRFGTIVILIARQNGKTTWWKILTLYVMYVLGMKLVLSTAQDLDTAEETWQAVVDLVLEQDDDENFLRPDLAEMVYRVVQRNGSKSLDLKTKERYKAKAASRRAGRGLSGDLIGLDEAREQQTWDSWSAITHTTMAREKSLIFLLSNAGDTTSVVLRYFRKLAHGMLGDPDGVNAADDPAALLDEADDVGLDDDEDLGLFEWSAVPAMPVRDRQGWAQANPAMNYPDGIAERKIKAALKEPEWIFRTEVLCQWSDGGLEGPFPAGAWDAGMVGAESQIVGDVAACVDVSIDRTWSCIAFAGRTSEGTPQVELVARRAGQDWVKDWLLERKSIVVALTGQSRGAPVSALMDELSEAGLPVVAWAGGDVPAATGGFYDLIRDNSLLHTGPQPPLDIAAAVAVPKLTEGGAFMWDRRKSPADVSPLQAATGAVWLLNRPVQDTSSAYENYDLMII